MPRATPTLLFLAVSAAAAYFGALGPAHRAELFGLATFAVLASVARAAGVVRPKTR